MSDNRVYVQGVGFDNLTCDEAVGKALGLMGERRGAYAVTPNPEIVWLAAENAALKTAVNSADLVLADGIGIVYAAKILGKPLKQKLPGIDFINALFGRMSENGQSVYLLGAKPGTDGKPSVAELAAESLKKAYPGIVISGTHHGYFTDDAEIVAAIREKAPDLLLVCLGFPKQELWMYKYCGKLKEGVNPLPVGLMAGLGGSLDVFAGVTKRAPEAMRKLGLEWLYRLYKEPRRAGRMTVLPKFLLRTIVRNV